MVMVMRLLSREVPCQAGVLGTSAMQYDNQSTAGNIFRCTERILDGYEDIWNPLLCIADGILLILVKSIMFYYLQTFYTYAS